jgi:hypothetical protein
VRPQVVPELTLLVASADEPKRNADVMLKKVRHSAGIGIGLVRCAAASKRFAACTGRPLTARSQFSV